MQQLLGLVSNPNSFSFPTKFCQDSSTALIVLYTATLLSCTSISTLVLLNLLKYPLLTNASQNECPFMFIDAMFLCSLAFIEHDDMSDQV